MKFGFEKKKDSEGKIDPSTSSIFEGNLKLKLQSDGNYKDLVSGEKFVRISKNRNLQRFTSLLVKPIMNTADIVEVDDGYFSHIQNLEDVKSQETGEKFTTKADADIFLLENIFGDSDHDYMHVIPEELDRNTTEFNNLIVNKKIGSYSLFDYNLSFHDTKQKNNKDTFPGLAKEIIEERRRRHRNDEEFFAFVKIIKDKTGVLLSSVLKEDFFNAVIKKSKISFSPRNFMFFKFKNEGGEEGARAKEMLEYLRYVTDAFHKGAEAILEERGK